MRESSLPPIPLMASLGMALGFYPGPAAAPAALCAAFLAAGLGACLRASPQPCSGLPRRLRQKPRSLAALAYASAFGLVAGAGLTLEAGGPPQALPAPARAVRIVGIDGRLSADSSPARKGFRSYQLRADRLRVSSGRILGELGFKASRNPSYRIFVRGGPSLDEGARLAVRGGPGEAGGAVFAAPGELLVLGRGSQLDQTRSGLRNACRTALKRAGRESGGLLEALLIGAQDDLELEDAQAFKAAGCSHILALSGQHLSVLAVIALAGLRPLLGPMRARFGAALLAAAFMWIAGDGPSLLRSVLMVWIAAIALALDRPQSWLQCLALAFALALPFDPGAARSPGFTLSYAAILGLAILSPRFDFAFGPWLPPFASKALAASFGAQAAVSPILVFTFGIFQPIGILASVLAAPLVLALMWWGMAAAIVCTILPAAASLAAPVSDALYRLLVAVMRTAAEVPALVLAGAAGKFLVTGAVAGFAAFVYARPYAEHRSSRRRPHSGNGSPRSRLRCALVAEGPSRA